MREFGETNHWKLVKSGLFGLKNRDFSVDYMSKTASASLKLTGFGRKLFTSSQKSRIFSNFPTKQQQKIELF